MVLPLDTEAQEQFSCVSDSMQKHIAVWELLAQFLLSACIHEHLPKTRGPITCAQGTDNSFADAVSAKGITMNAGMADVLTAYFAFSHAACSSVRSGVSHPRPPERTRGRT